MRFSYDEKYLDDAMKNLGEAFDYAANKCGMNLDEFAGLFVSSGIAALFGNGTPKFVSGLSGTELFMYVLDKVGYSIEYPDPQLEYDYSPQYWTGWILAYCQWKMGISFKELHSYISMEELLKMYSPLHEASEDKTVDAVEAIIYRKKPGSKLQTQRKLLGLSQKELAEKSGVNLRTLQQYEINAKDLSKASFSSVYSLASVLGCEVNDIVDNIKAYGDIT